MRLSAIAFVCTCLGACAVVVAGCSSDDSSDDSSQSMIPPSTCPAEPCTTGAICYGPAESTCNGTWYCWNDGKWYCAPPDSGGPGGPPPDGGVGGGDATSGSPDATGDSSHGVDAPGG